MNDTGISFLIGALSFVILILIAVFKKVQETYGAKKAFRYFALTIIAILALILFPWNFIKNSWNSISCGCDNVDDCLSKYKFVEARKYAAELPNTYIVNDWKYFFGIESNVRVTKNEELFKIICNESEYWINQNELEKAENVSNELKSIILNYVGLGDRISQFELDNKGIEIKLKIILKLSEKHQFDKAKLLAIKLPEKQPINIEEKYFSNKQEYNIYKRGLKSIQEIEEWKGSDYYKITTYVYPREEALKIIDEYKKEK